MLQSRHCRTRNLLLGIMVLFLCFLYWYPQPDEFSLEYCISTRKFDGSSRLHLIIQFPVLNISGSFKDSHSVERQLEYTYSLQQNLLSPHVQEVHILCESDQDPHFIKALNLANGDKLVFHSLGKRMTFKDAFGFASTHLLRQNTMILQADCYIGEGFEHLDKTILSDKTMYFLTRHVTPGNISSSCNHHDPCGPMTSYIGSHDAYLFRLLVPVPSHLLDKVDYPSYLYGIEQVIIFHFKKYGGFKIKNPCKILHIVHHHCKKPDTNHSYIHGQRLDDYLNLSVQHRKGEEILASFSCL